MLTIDQRLIAPEDFGQDHRLASVAEGAFSHTTHIDSRLINLRSITRIGVIASDNPPNPSLIRGEYCESLYLHFSSAR
jgi:hypothetical protein